MPTEPKKDAALMERLDKCLVRFGAIRLGVNSSPSTHLLSGTGGAKGSGEGTSMFRCPLTGQVTRMPPPVPNKKDNVPQGSSTAGTGAKSIFFRDHYHFYPNPQDSATALLGEGGYGKAYRVRSASNFSTAETKVCKVIKKVRCTQHESQIRHLCAEIAILTRVAPECPRLNQARACFFDAEYVYIVLDMTTANNSPDVASRLYTLFVRDAPENIPRVEPTVQRWHDDWEVNRAPLVREKYLNATRSASGASDAPLQDLIPVTPAGLQDVVNAAKREFLDNQVKAVIKNCRLKPEPSYQMDLYDYVYKSHYGRKCLPEAEAAVILKQCLQGIEFMHRSGIVHRDIKTENVVIGISRVVTPVYEGDEEPNLNSGGEEADDGGDAKKQHKDPEAQPPAKKRTITGLVFHDTIDAQLIDFGLVKHMGYRAPSGSGIPSPSKFGYVPSPKISVPALAVYSRSSTMSWMGDSTNVSIDRLSPRPQGANPLKSQSNESGSTASLRKNSSGMSAAEWGKSEMPAKPAEMAREFGTEKLAPGSCISCTPCGTDVYVALEGLLGMKGKGKDDHWMSTVEDLPKLDIFGLGAMHYFMVHGHAPFRVNKIMPPYPEHCRSAKEQREWKLKHLIDLVEKGPSFKASVFSGTQDLLSKMLDNEPKARPTAYDLLQDPYFARVTDRYCYSVNLQGKEMPRLDSTVFDVTPNTHVLPVPEQQGGSVPLKQYKFGNSLSSDAKKGPEGAPQQMPQILNIEIETSGQTRRSKNPLQLPPPGPSARAKTKSSTVSSSVEVEDETEETQGEDQPNGGGGETDKNELSLSERRGQTQTTLENLRSELGGYSHGPPKAGGGTGTAAFPNDNDEEEESEEDEEEAAYNASGTDVDHTIRKGHHSDLMAAIRAMEDNQLPGSVPDDDDE